MDHQPLPNVTSGSLSPELRSATSQKHDISSVIDLRPVDAGIQSINNEIQPVQEDIQQVTQDMHRVSGQLHQVNSTMSVVGDELTLTDDDIQQVNEDHTQVSDPLAVGNEDTLTMDGEITDMERNQDVQVITHQVNINIECDCNFFLLPCSLRLLHNYNSIVL